MTIGYMTFMLCIQKLSHFGYTLLSVSLRLSPLSPYVHVKIFGILKNKKIKNKTLHRNIYWIIEY